MSDAAPCQWGDPTCPCQDGDLCHYEGPDASPVVMYGPRAGERVTSAGPGEWGENPYLSPDARRRFEELSGP